MKYRIEYLTKIGTEETEIEAANEDFARLAFYEIYNRTIQILSVSIMHTQAA